MRYTQEKKIAMEAVRKAAALCSEVRADMVDVEAIEKGDKSPVTVADYAVQAIIALASSLNLDVIAEGVETSEQLEFLRGQRCAVMQGFLFSAPEPAETVVKVLGERLAGRQR